MVILMNKYEKLQEMLYREVMDSKELSDTERAKMMKIITVTTKRINRIEAVNFIEFAKSEGLL